MTNNQTTVTLANGVTMPRLGLGVWQAEEGGEVEQAIDIALDAGYRLIDTAAIYDNEAGVGQAIHDSQVDRSEIFVTTKLWNTDHGYNEALQAFEESLNKLGLDYLDLYLIHWPQPQASDVKASWRALEKLYSEGRVRAIGVSNFKPHHLDDLMADCEIMPMVNQIELHPYLTQNETRDYCEAYEIQVESYSPLMRGGAALDEPMILDLAKKYQKQPGQIILRWHVQQDLVAIPKSVTPKRIRDNIDIFDFALTSSELVAINQLEPQERLLADPDNI